MMSLQTHILDFTQRLHSVELERRELLQEVSRLHEEIEKQGPETEELISEHTDVAITKMVIFVVIPKFYKPTSVSWSF